MKHSLLFLMASLFLWAGFACSDDDDKSTDKPQPEEKHEVVFEGGAAPVLEFPAEGGEASFSFTSTDYWMLYMNDEAYSWLDFSQEMGKGGSYTVTVTADKSYADEAREVQIKLISWESEYPITLKQGFTGRLELQEGRKFIPEAGGDFTVKVGHSVDYDVTIGADWITQKQVRGFVEDELTFTATKNETGDTREGVITFTTKDGKISKNFTVYQVVAVEIPDPAFKAYLVENFDNDGDGEMSSGEMEQIRWINVNTAEVASLAGIEKMTNLTSMDVCGVDDDTPNGKLTELDLSLCPKLQSLRCTNNQLTSLDLTPCKDLNTLNCSYNKLTSVNANGLTKLSWVVCDNNQLTELDLTGCVALSTLQCFSNKLTTLDLSVCTELAELDAEENQLASLKLPQSAKLQKMFLGTNKLSGKLELKDCPELYRVRASSNNLEEIVFSNCPKMEQLELGENKLSTFDASGLPVLNSVDVDYNNLTGLDFTKNPKMEYLYCQYNPQLKQVLVAKGHNVTDFYYDKTVTEIVYQ